MLDRIIGEAIGTCIFSFIIAVADTGDFFTGNFGHPFSLGGGAVVLMMLAGFSTDPHLNPAVTLGHFTRYVLFNGFTKVALLEHGLIILTQFLAAFPGAFLGWGLNTSMIYFAPANHSTQGQAFLAEMVFTSLIVGVALMIGKTKDSRILGSIVLGAAYFAGVECVSYYSGACFNPALGLAINTVKQVEDGTHIEHTWIYILAPFAGGLIGGIVNSLLIMGGSEVTENEKDLLLRGIDED